MRPAAARAGSGQGAVSETRSRVRVIIALRADFYDRPLQYPAFGELVMSHLETLLPLSAQELERAIVEPAHRVTNHLQITETSGDLQSN